MINADPHTFRNEVIERYHAEPLKRYIDLKAKGHSSIAALIGAFGHDFARSMNPFEYINYIETSDAYARGYAAAVAAMADNPLWDAETSARVLFSIATDETAKRAERIAAAKELNVLFGITIIDDKGNTRIGEHTLDDLFRLKAHAANAAQTTH